MGAGLWIAHAGELQVQPHSHPQAVGQSQLMGDQGAQQLHMGFQLAQQLRRAQPHGVNLPPSLRESQRARASRLPRFQPLIPNPPAA